MSLCQGSLHCGNLPTGHAEMQRHRSIGRLPGSMHARHERARVPRDVIRRDAQW